MGRVEHVTEGWGEFGVAAAGATAALAGLLVVAISVNVREILASRSATAGARSTLGALVLAIITSLLLLFPAQPALLLGIEVLVLTIPAAASQVASIVTQSRLATEGLTAGTFTFIIALAILQFAPFLAAGVLLLAGSWLGPWLIATGVVMVVISSMVGAWVLLLEVQR